MPIDHTCQTAPQASTTGARCEVLSAPRIEDPMTRHLYALTDAVKANALTDILDGKTRGHGVEIPFIGKTPGHVTENP